ncbi:phage minor capsid protein [Populibacterium corticicola]|uniref:Phage minor capsid protein n=1 Tax=Populibacterium corticicola TaxID=1812826 RepID=A0ABW5XD67_9MICO
MSAVDRDLIEQVLAIIRAAELAIFRRISQRLTPVEESTDWAVEKLAQLGILQREITSELNAMNADLAVAVRQAVTDAYTAGGAAINPSVPLIPSQPAALTALAHDIVGKTVALSPVVLRSTVDAYRQAASAHLGKLILSVQTRRETSQDILNTLLGQGVTGFTDKSGRNWRLDSYVEMATRSGLGNAYLNGRVDTLQAGGYDLVYVIPGPTACPSCDMWIGKILSLSGDTPSTDEIPVAASLAEARSSGHLFGPNCRCVLAAYQHGHTDLPTEHADPAGYIAEQKQRRLERAVRDAKREEALALTPAAKRAAHRAVMDRQAAVRAHIADNPVLKRQYAREQLAITPERPRAVVPPYTDREAWKKRQQAITSVDFHGEVLEPHEVRFVERMQARGERLTWIPRPPATTGGFASSNDFIWDSHEALVMELKGTKPKYQSVKNNIRTAVLKAQKHSVVKENFIIDIGDETLPDKVRGQLADYNRLVETAQIKSLWVLSEDGTKLEQITLR